jgi:uncharacterized protein YndB with AHSA1/START domain
MTTKLHHEVLIAAPAAAVWSALADLAGVQAYNPGVERASYVSAQREGVGAARRCEFRGGGSVTERVTEWQPAQTIAFEMTDHPWPMTAARFRMVLAPDAGGTRLLQETEYEFTGDAAAAEAVRQQWDQGVAAVTTAFKRHVESTAEGG